MDNLESCTVVINPRRYPRAVSKLEKILERTDVSKVIISKSKEDFIYSVENFYENNSENLLVWGGDGTAHDAINALMNAKAKTTIPKKKSIGFLRGGSGNGIQDSYEVPHYLVRPLEKQLECYSESMKNGYKIDVNLIKINQDNLESYCQLAGFGFDVEVLKRRESRIYKKGVLRGEARAGMKNYILSSLSALSSGFSAIENDFEIELCDGKNVVVGQRTRAEHEFNSLLRRTTAPLIEMGVRPYYGKMFKICPEVVCNDGYMNLYLFNFKDEWDALKNVFWLYTGRHDQINRKFISDTRPPIERYKIKKAAISSEKEFYYHIDGELKLSEKSDDELYRISFEVVQNAINFLVPKTFYKSFNWFDEDPEIISKT